MANKFCPVSLGLLFLFITAAAVAQNVGVGTATPNASAQLDVTSTTRGLLIPRMTTAEVLAISNPAKGLLVYDSSKKQLMVNSGTPSTPVWQSTTSSSAWGLSGNTGTDAARQFLGSVDSSAVNFRVNNIPAGKLDPLGNISWGLRSGQSLSTGYSNVAIGTDALRATNNHGTIAIGDSALMNSTEWNNLAIGSQALMNTTTGAANMAIGGHALGDNITGNNNTAVGGNALGTLQSGSFNVAVGGGTMLWNKTGASNVAVGDYALFYNNYNYNTAVGEFALKNTTLSAYNTALGYGAGDGTDNGYNNVFLGANTGTTGDGFYNCIAIGQDVYCNGSNQVRIGNAATGLIGGYVQWSVFSDGRIKKDVSENVRGLDFILKLRPVTYRLDMVAIEQWKTAEGIVHRTAVKANPSDNDSRRFSGFIAQEVDKASRESGYDFSGVDKPKDERSLYMLRYAEFVVPLVKATQELNAKVEGLEKQNALLLRQNAALLQRLAALESKIK